MSLQTWKDEFYPEEPTKHMTAIEATKHSLRKWEGALAKNLKKHGVKYVYFDVREIESGTNLSFVANTCALCEKFFNDKVDWREKEPCSRCPLFKHLGESCSPRYRNGVYERSEINPTPMIRALRGTLAMLQRKPKKGSK